MKTFYSLSIFLFALLFSCSAPGTAGVLGVKSGTTVIDSGKITKESLDGTTWFGPYSVIQPNGYTGWAGIRYENGVVFSVGGADGPEEVLDALNGGYLLPADYTIDNDKKEIVIPLIPGKKRPYLLITYLDERTVQYEQVPPNKPGEKAYLKHSSFFEELN